MNIWLINHYAVPPKYFPLARQTYFAKYLMQRGHQVTIFAASTVHNSDKNLITNGVRYRKEVVDGVSYVYIKCRGYKGNGLSRVYNMMEFAWKLSGVCKKFSKPDAIVATSMPPMSCAAGIRIARHYRCVGVAEIADLWPESIVAYGVAGKNNPGVLLLRRLEKWIYKKSDAVVFTMEGAYDYIIDQGWEKEIPSSKVYFINNGVDLKEFDYNKEHFQVEDADLNDHETFKIVYAGSIRKANNLGLLLDVAKVVDNPRVRFLIWGNGDELPALRQRLKDENINNVLFKGRVDKKYVPFITSHANLTILNYEMHDIWKYGGSQNKLFEYFAGGTPVLTNLVMGRDLIDRYQCGFHIDYSDINQAAKRISEIAATNRDDYDRLCQNARHAAEDYDFPKLTQKLIDLIEVQMKKRRED